MVTEEIGQYGKGVRNPTQLIEEAYQRGKEDGKAEVEGKIGTHFGGSLSGSMDSGKVPKCPPNPPQQTGALGRLAPPAAPATKEITHPSHYFRGGIEGKDVIEAWGLNFYMGNALKYICRADYKGAPIKDLQKAIQNLQFEVERRHKAEHFGSALQAYNPKTWGGYPASSGQSGHVGSKNE